MARMTKEDKDSETNPSQWIEDVVNRALTSSFGSDEKIANESNHNDENDDAYKPSEQEGTFEHYPYPDEDESSKVIEPTQEASEEVSKKSVRKAIEWLAVIVGALLVAFLIKTFLMQAYYIPSSSMTPALQVGERVLVNKLSYEFGDISRGDLVVFKQTEVETENKIDLIKRVIATEGELIEISDGEIFITERNESQRKLLVEPYLAEGVSTQGFAFEGLCPESQPNTCLVPEDSLFVMGDNRSGSRDSRYFGPVNANDVVGRAFIRIWPLGSLKLL